MFFLLHVWEEFRGKNISLTTKDFEHDLVEEGNHNVTNWHHRELVAKSGTVQV